MPKIYNYLGIIIFFYSNEHEPIHVHAQKDGKESKAEFIILNGKIIEIKITNIKGVKPLEGRVLKNFKIFLNEYSERVVEKWINYFVYHKEVNFEKINTKIK